MVSPLGTLFNSKGCFEYIRKPKTLKDALPTVTDPNRCEDGGTPILQQAVMLRGVEAIKILLRDPRVDPTGATYRTLEHPLNLAIANNDLEVVDLLLDDERVDVNMCGSGAGSTSIPFVLATRSCRSEKIVRRMLREPSLRIPRDFCTRYSTHANYMGLVSIRLIAECLVEKLGVSDLCRIIFEFYDTRLYLTPEGYIWLQEEDLI